MKDWRVVIAREIKAFALPQLVYFPIGRARHLHAEFEFPSGLLSVNPTTEFMTTIARDFIRQWLIGLGRGALLVWETVVSIFTHRPPWRDVIHQMYFIGVKSQSVVLITGAFTGMVLCAQTYFQFH